MAIKRSTSHSIITLKRIVEIIENVRGNSRNRWYVSHIDAKRITRTVEISNSERQLGRFYQEKADKSYRKAIVAFGLINSHKASQDELGFSNLLDFTDYRLPSKKLFLERLLDGKDALTIEDVPESITNYPLNDIGMYSAPDGVEERRGEYKLRYTYADLMTQLTAVAGLALRDKNAMEMLKKFFDDFYGCFGNKDGRTVPSLRASGKPQQLHSRTGSRRIKAKRKKILL